MRVLTGTRTHTRVACVCLISFLCFAVFRVGLVVDLLASAAGPLDESFIYLQRTENENRKNGINTMSSKSMACVKIAQVEKP